MHTATIAQWEFDDEVGDPQDDVVVVAEVSSAGTGHQVPSSRVVAAPTGAVIRTGDRGVPTGNQHRYWWSPSVTNGGASCTHLSWV